MKSNCKICGEEFSNYITIDGKRIHCRGRLVCFDCKPYTAMQQIKDNSKPKIIYKKMIVVRFVEIKSRNNIFLEHLRGDCVKHVGLP